MSRQQNTYFTDITEQQMETLLAIYAPCNASELTRLAIDQMYHRDTMMIDIYRVDESGDIIIKSLGGWVGETPVYFGSLHEATVAVKTLSPAYYVQDETGLSVMAVKWKQLLSEKLRKEE